MNGKKKIVIVGATSAIAEQCARLWVQSKPIALTLIARDTQKTGTIVTDLQIRSPQSNINIIYTDFLNPKKIKETVEKISASGKIDIALIAHGSLPEQSSCQDDLQTCWYALEVNGSSPALWAEAFAQHMEKNNHGTIALIGSVAGDRGRKSNYVYGAAKGLVARYAQGLQHRFAGTAVNIVLIKPGPTDTPMTANLKRQGAKLSPAEDVAKKIVNDINFGKKIVYTPRKWWLIMMVVRHLPSFIFNKMNI
ncbi:MAG: SDR family NAD(P)-dependent oxidoreductase [Burkholderiales bacterium]|jgi:short-subunit dehydrogenase|nr:SDR family NAD(P)-dependent oxidoreductase [Burkholderiales bacterium]